MATETYISVKGANGESKTINIDMLPQECPLCHRGQQPINQNIAFLGSDSVEKGIYVIQAAFRCVFHDCERIFVSHYGYLSSTAKARFMNSQPSKFIGREWEESVKQVSPDFIEIYNQSSEAENKGLLRIAGPGYRKALEFLIKDWLIADNRDASEVINVKQLSVCINEYITEEHIKNVASRASWLGNDETHYYRKWSNKDINDLKRLIELTANWINMHELSNSFVSDMPKATKNIKA